MSGAIKLYFRYLAVSLRAQMQYRAAFLMQTASMFLTTIMEIAAIWVLFSLGQLRGWRLAEVGLFYGLVNVGFALAEGFGRGFDTFDRMVKQGDFDRLLLRPRGLAFQVAAQELQLMRIGRLAQGLIVLIWSAAALDVAWTTARVALTTFAVAGGACMFYGLFVLQATLAFWTVDSLEIMNTVTYGGTEAGQYPMPVYRPWFRKFFTFVVPLACVTYFPGLAILGRPDAVAGSPAWFQWSAPAIGILFMIVSLRVWGIGVKHYQSTGS